MGNIFSLNVSADLDLNSLFNCVIENVLSGFKLDQKVEELETALGKLKAQHSDVLRKVCAGEGPNMKRLDKVQEWLSRVERMENVVDQLLVDADTQKAQKLCLCGCFSGNNGSSCEYGKMISQKLSEIQQLMAEGEYFDVVVERMAPPKVNEMPIGSIVGQKPMLKLVWDRLMEENAGILGIYGVEGVGKTTLLTQIHNKFVSTQHDFETVMWVEVGKDPQSLERIQEDIGRQIGFSHDDWKHKRFDQRAQDIFRVLKSEKFALLLDDVWERIDLVKIGVPPSDKNNVCKIVLAARLKDHCDRMRANFTTKVEGLVWNDAWELFAREVGENTLSAHPHIPTFAKGVARSCQGLPRTLVAHGQAMTSKRTIQEWMAAYNSPGTNYHEILKYIFDYDEKLRSCFLYCTLFPKDHKIRKHDDLIDYWIGEEILYGNEARFEGYNIIRTLIDMGLLIEEDGSCVKLDDESRSMANRYKKERGDFCVLENSLFRRVRKSKAVKRLSMMAADQIDSLMWTSKYPNLLALLLRGNKITSVSSNFIQCMPKLRVLDLSNNLLLQELPEGVSELVSLQYLNISDTNIKWLPEGFQKLTQLKYLNLEYCKQLVYLPPLSSFSNLQVLKLYQDCGFNQYKYQELVKEIQGLDHLNLLTVSIRVQAAASLEWILETKLGDCTNILMLHECRSRLLDISCLGNIKSLNGLKILDCYSEDVNFGWEHERVSHLEDPRSSQVLRNKCFENLESLQLYYCTRLRHLTWLILLPNLKCLRLSLMLFLLDIIYEQVEDDIAERHQSLIPFTKLQVLYIEGAKFLKSIYWKPLPFPSLKEFTVIDCPSLEKLPLNYGSAKGCDLVINAEKEWVEALKWDYKADRDFFISKVVN